MSASAVCWFLIVERRWVALAQLSYHPQATSASVQQQQLAFDSWSLMASSWLVWASSCAVQAMRSLSTGPHRCAMEGLVLSLHSLQKAVDLSIDAIDSRMLCFVLRTRLNKVAPLLTAITTHCYHSSLLTLLTGGGRLRFSGFGTMPRCQRWIACCGRLGGPVTP